MADKRVVRYIKENLLNGHSLLSIKKHLLAHGHHKKEVNEAISCVNRDYELNRVIPE